MSGTHGHGHGCAADHHRGEYTERQRADLDMVLAFNERLARAVDDTLDITDTVAVLDPDPLRYMWVDEGDGQIPAQLAKAAAVLDLAPRLAGQTRAAVRPLPDCHNAARPSVAAHGAVTLVGWLEWEPDRGDRLVAELTVGASSRRTVVIDEPEDLFRPTAAVTADGVPWLLFGRRVDGPDGVARVGVWASRFVDGAWSGPEPVSTTGGAASDGPSFNQEAVAHPDGSLHVCWQGPLGDRFGVFARRFADGAWGDPVPVSAGVTDNVWDPTLAVTPAGMAYAWAEYADGSYRIAVCEIGDGAGPIRRLTGGTDYALHPSLATTTDGSLWCAFDVVTVQGHGGSGPTRLRPRPRAGERSDEPDGMREPGASVPPELLPEVSAGIRVVRVDADGLVEPPGELARGLNVVPSALPRLAATADGGLVVGYRIHRQLPLMTYYWEAAAQVLGPDGWRPPITFGGTDATLEEVSLAAAGPRVLLATQADGRLARALTWTEGFGGRECPYLADHHGAVIWHGVHGAGQVVLTVVESAGPAATDGARTALVTSDTRREARRWAGASREARYATDGYQLYWGDLHRHSLVSRCTSGDEPSLEDFYRYAWDVDEYDFWAVTDHAENSTAYQWWSIQKIADLLHVPGRFVPLYGFEWTSAERGHQNVIYGDVTRGAPIFSAFAEGSTTPDGLWRGLAAHPEFPAITIPHHPGSAMVHNDWDFHDPRFSRLVEVFQACRGNYESESCFRQYSDGTATGTFMLDGLARGHRFGLIASSDHGHGASYVAVLARSLSRKDVFDALWSRRTCAATTRGVMAVLRLGPHLMGSEVDWDGPRPLRVHARGYGELARVDIVRDGRVVHVVRGEPPLAPGQCRVDLRVEWGQADTTTRWDGRLAVDGGRLVLPAFVGPEVVAFDSRAVAWEHVTHSFGEPYGAQRGGVEVSVCGTADTQVRIDVGGRSVRIGLAELADRLARGAFVPDGDGPGTLALQPAVGALLGLGVRELDVSFDDDVADPAFYYARVFQTDGEMAWSSPLWVG